MANILVVDDDKEIRTIVKECLFREGHIVHTAENAEDAYKKLEFMPDLLLLDVMMPGKDGFTLCRELRRRLDIPILFITAKTRPQDLVEGLAIGADEYIKKPFSIIELRARVNAHLRRETREKHNRYVLDLFNFDLAGFTLLYEDKEIILTKTEYNLAEYLALHHGQVFSKQQLFDTVWGIGYTWRRSKNS